MPGMTRYLSVLPALCAALLSAACASVAEPVAIGGRGAVLSIQETQRTSTASGVVGTVGGAVVGGALGSLIGGGTGRTIATTVGAVGGAMAGSAIADKHATETVWVVSIRFDDGIDRAVTVSQRPNYRPGDRVRVDNGVVSPLAAE
jgi:outer membrane lipoprotein SlyB